VKQMNFSPNAAGTRFEVLYQHDGSASASLPPGVYTFALPPMTPPYFARLFVQTDRLLRFTDGPGKQICDDIKSFLTPDVAARFKCYGYMHRRGVLMYGKPGTGKTSLVMQIAEQFVADGGVVLMNVTPDKVTLATQMARRGNPDLRVLVVIEELDDEIDNGWLGTITNLLDGSGSSANTVYLATTNHIDRIPNKLKVRPSRFALVIEVGPPSVDVRRQYILGILKEEDKATFDVERAVGFTEGFTLDQIKEFLVSVLCFLVDPEEAAARLRQIETLADGEDDE
jgi:hypothetical protein